MKGSLPGPSGSLSGPFRISLRSCQGNTLRNNLKTSLGNALMILFKDSFAGLSKELFKDVSKYYYYLPKKLLRTSVRKYLRMSQTMFPEQGAFNT